MRLRKITLVGARLESGRSVFCSNPDEKQTMSTIAVAMYTIGYRCEIEVVGCGD